MIERAHQGDKNAREQLVLENMGLIWSIVKRFSGRGYEAEDLFQIGSIGLIKAIDKFDLSYDVKFSTYAVPMITGEIRRFLRDDGMIKVSRSLKELGLKVRLARESLGFSLGREPTVEEIAQEVGAAREEVAASLDAAALVESLDQSVGSGEDQKLLLMDRIEDKRKDEEALLNRMVLEELLRELSGRERELILRRYFEDQTQTQVAKALGISQVQVSRMEKRILLDMRKRVQGKKS